jgi:hypothetical protein
MYHIKAPAQEKTELLQRKRAAEAAFLAVTTLSKRD